MKSKLSLPKQVMSDFVSALVPQVLQRLEDAKKQFRELGAASNDPSIRIMNDFCRHSLEDIARQVDLSGDPTAISATTTTISTVTTITPRASTCATVSVRSVGTQTEDFARNKRSFENFMDYLSVGSGGDDGGCGGGHFDTALATRGHRTDGDLMSEDDGDVDLSQRPGSSKMPRLDGHYGLGHDDARVRSSASDTIPSPIVPDGTSFGGDQTSGRGQFPANVVVDGDRMSKLRLRIGDGPYHYDGLRCSTPNNNSILIHDNGDGQVGSSSAYDPFLASPGGLDGLQSSNFRTFSNSDNNDHNNSEASEEDELVDDDQLRVDDSLVGSPPLPANYASLTEILNTNFGNQVEASREVTTAAVSTSFTSSPAATALMPLSAYEPVSPIPSPIYRSLEAGPRSEEVDQFDHSLSVQGSPQFLSEFDLPLSRLPSTSSSSVEAIESEKKDDDDDRDKEKLKIKKKDRMVITVNLDCIKKGCDIVSFDAADLDGHLQEDHRIGRVQCFVKGCGESFYSVKMSSHLKSDKHLNDPRIICHYCGRQYQWYHNLKQHVIDYHQTGTFRCGGSGGGGNVSDCSFIAKTRAEVYRHYRKVHGGGGGARVCTGPEEEEDGEGGVGGAVRVNIKEEYDEDESQK